MNEKAENGAAQDAEPGRRGGDAPAEQQAINAKTANRRRVQDAQARRALPEPF